MEEKKLRKKEEEIEFERQKQDLINMRIEMEKIRECNIIEKKSKKDFMASYIRKPESQLEYERNLILEQEEEDEINKIYMNYAQRFQKERKEKEKFILKNKIAKREKTSSDLAIKLQELWEKNKKIHGVCEVETFFFGEEKERPKKSCEIYEQMKKDEENLKRKRLEAKEAIKWEAIQVCRRNEMNKKWKEDFEKKIREKQRAVRADLDQQCREKEEMRKAEYLKEMSEMIENNNRLIEDELEYCEEGLRFVKEQNLPPYPVLWAVAVNIITIFNIKFILIILIFFLIILLGCQEKKWNVEGQ